MRIRTEERATTKAVFSKQFGQSKFNTYGYTAKNKKHYSFYSTYILLNCFYAFWGPIIFSSVQDYSSVAGNFIHLIQHGFWVMFYHLCVHMETHGFSHSLPAWKLISTTTCENGWSDVSLLTCGLSCNTRNRRFVDSNHSKHQNTFACNHFDVSKLALVLLDDATRLNEPYECCVRLCPKPFVKNH